MQKKNVYDRARSVVRELAPLLHAIREQDKSLADQLKRAAQSVVLNIAEARGNDAGNARARFSTACGSAKEVRAARGCEPSFRGSRIVSIGFCDVENDAVHRPMDLVEQ